MEIELPESLRGLAKEKIYLYGINSIKAIDILDQLTLLSIGAEAYILRGKFMGIDSIIKWRFPKPYIPPDLDRDFRRFRTEIESKVMWKALSVGVKAPIPLYIDVDDAIIVMTYIEGNTLRDIVDIIDSEKLCKICQEIGVYTAKMHNIGISHGDLTTSNIIVNFKEGYVYLIDFGLASFCKRDEDYAIDIHIFFRAIESAHIAHEKTMKSCFINGYELISGDSKTVKMLKIVNDIRKRGRYVAERKLRSEWRSA
uniref:non-specific serine/threonine protein kinase n=1 Tax=Ignisphaera aggregans TaxID=334771 RepID=A0A7C5UWM3_9CREN